jgi:hypothetical protein
MARRERTEATVLGDGAALADRTHAHRAIAGSKRRDDAEHGGRMRGGRAERGERCAANSAGAVAALHEAPTAVVVRV